MVLYSTRKRSSGMLKAEVSWDAGSLNLKLTSSKVQVSVQSRF